jgi:hypothetical protein
MSHRPKRIAEKRPSEWATWQGRLVWEIDRAVNGAFAESYSAASLEWGFQRTQLKTWRDRLSGGGDLHISTLFRLQQKLGFSWEWFLHNTGWPTQEVARLHGSHLRSVPDSNDDE